MEKKKIVFLYSELATYFLACVEKLSAEPNIEVHIVRWEVNNEAPFHFSFSDSIKIYNRKDYTSDEQLQQLISGINPAIIYSSGWMDKGYLQICKAYKKKIPVIVGFDNQWKGSLKQYIATLISPFKILNHFTHCWVPGDLQYEYAVRLGFKKQNILTGFYCCDFDFFYGQYLQNTAQKKANFPKRFIYVGRYTEHKGIRDLWQAFIELQEAPEQKNNPDKWELWCLGTGDVKPVEHPQIRHFGFVQPAEMASFIKDTGVFVLPSHFEPWGVVVHEFTAAGFPVICSDETGARTAFVQNDFNGYIYKAGAIPELKAAFLRMMNAGNEKLVHMSENSVAKAKKITPDTWVKQLVSLL